ncbi:MAG: proteasome accessory factor PafA2 [Actinobacteria bacterium]|nr:proteasome accessory factor PafA2 [Actinomycetota bacterium]MCL6094245.1 proteasome accessory factor PafA2 [Actinomycetota bacterium]
MAIAKVCGTETEYGIRLLGSSADHPSGEPNAMALASMLVNAYVARVDKLVGWDFEDESPGRDARGFAREGSPPEIDTRLVNSVLTNGARYYVDHAHPEYSTPECSNPIELVCADKAGELVLAASIEAANRVFRDGEGIAVYKNNSDGKGNSYGCHENYLMDRATPFSRIVRHVVPHFVSRQIFTGAGKLGSEGPGANDEVVRYQLSQRADFFEEEVGLETTVKRPIVNTRDEPHADPRRFRRFHVIVGDANLAETATFLKVGTTALVLAMIEDDYLSKVDLTLANPVRAIRQVSRDLELNQPLEMADGRRMSAVQIQWVLFEVASKYAQVGGLACFGDEGVGRAVLSSWEEVLQALETDPMSLDKQLDWVAKLRLIEAYKDRHGLDWSDRRLALLDLQYHDVRPGRSLFQRLDMVKLCDPKEVVEAVDNPPRSTRAYFRGTCLRRWAPYVQAANWDSIVFDLGKDPLRRVPMMDPLKGTAEHVESLLEGCNDPAELLERLSA